jgi:hypothetical protein
VALSRRSAILGKQTTLPADSVCNISVTISIPSHLISGGGLFRWINSHLEWRSSPPDPPLHQPPDPPDPPSPQQMHLLYQLIAPMPSARRPCEDFYSRIVLSSSNLEFHRTILIWYAAIFRGPKYGCCTVGGYGGFFRNNNRVWYLLYIFICYCITRRPNSL